MMTVNNTQEERLLMKLIDEMPMADEIKQGWCDQIKTHGLSEELAQEMHEKLAAHPEGENTFPNRARCMAQLANLTRRWRLTAQKQIGKHH
jgi:hypothetical protein